MKTDIDYSDFGITEMKNIETGNYFLWSGMLYQKTESILLAPNPVSELESKNAFDVQNARICYFFDEEQVIPVNVYIKVSEVQ